MLFFNLLFVTSRLSAEVKIDINMIYIKLFVSILKQYIITNMSVPEVK